jgi:hypothetical protein
VDKNAWFVILIHDPGYHGMPAGKANQTDVVGGTILLSPQLAVRPLSRWYVHKDLLQLLLGIASWQHLTWIPFILGPRCYRPGDSLRDSWCSF